MRSTTRAMQASRPVAAHRDAPLQDRVVLVTGGAQGIGRGIAQAVLDAGGRVAIGDVDAEAGRACIDEWNAGDRALFRVLDVSREASAARFVAAALRVFGRIDGMVNNAGIATPGNGPIDRMPVAEWRRRLGTNLDGAFLCSRAALPALRAAADPPRRASGIVNIASTRAHQSEPHTEAYAAAKGGLVAFTHALAVSEGPRVRVNCVSPGWIVTDGWRKPSARRAPVLSAGDHAQHPVGRAGDPSDIGALVTWLLSDAAGFVTGQDIASDGGMGRRMRYD